MYLFIENKIKQKNKQLFLDIIIRLNAEQEPQIISTGHNENDYSTYALEVLNKEEICINEPFRPIGIFYSKAHQLQKLKYIPVIV